MSAMTIWVTVAVLALIAGSYLLFRWLRGKPLFAQSARAAGRAVFSLFEAVFRLLWLIFCALYAAWLGIRLSSRRVLTGLLKLVLISAAIYEGVATFLLHAYLPSLPWWGKVIVAIAAVMSITIHVREWVRSKQRPRLVTAIRSLLGEAVDLDVAGPAGKENVERFILETMVAISAAGGRKKREISLTFMDDTATRSELRVRHAWPSRDVYDRDFMVRAGEGGAGKAFQKRQTIYIPAIRMLHGIRILLPLEEDEEPEYELEEVTYKRTEREPFKENPSI